MRTKAIIPSGTASETDRGSRMARISPAAPPTLSLSETGPEKPTTPEMNPTKKPKAAIQRASFVKGQSSTRATTRINVSSARAVLPPCRRLCQLNDLKSFSSV